MHVERRTGTIPGIVFVTVRHHQSVVQFSSEVRIDTNNRYICRLPHNQWSTPCQSVDAALLLHAATLLPVADDAPWLENPRPAAFATPAHRHAAEIIAMNATMEAEPLPSRPSATQPSDAQMPDCTTV
ncbi:hypothetical protein AA103196_1852 [Ameyamaea chiangmaiensis NBRC 103196]|nr:hypothetical protein [Ameyamaea chiangmaiensis]MBS4073883.1 hypothetical protein [Ameyamaea chiangmaiensis]GBQ68070.1 hypothetical protein AA103196_1852 [Ameyamaea chiangmaiensis NBRC 103196]